MKRIVALSVVLLVLAMQIATAQQLYANDKVEYTFELPSATWKAISEPVSDLPMTGPTRSSRMSETMARSSSAMSARARPSRSRAAKMRCSVQSA